MSIGYNNKNRAQANLLEIQANLQRGVLLHPGEVLESRSILGSLANDLMTSLPGQGELELPFTHLRGVHVPLLELHKCLEVLSQEVAFEVLDGLPGHFSIINVIASTPLPFT